MNDTIMDGIFLDTPNRRGGEHGLYYSSDSYMYHAHYRYHPCRRSDLGYFPNEFKKAKPPTFDEELKNS